jgi:hypothetical protein
MSWIKGKPSAAEQPQKTARASAHRERGIHVPPDVEAGIAKFLISHNRLQERAGRPVMHFMGMTRNHDGSTDYAVRSRVHGPDGQQRDFDSHIRIQASGIFRLIR